MGGWVGGCAGVWRDGAGVHSRAQQAKWGLWALHAVDTLANGLTPGSWGEGLGVHSVHLAAAHPCSLQAFEAKRPARDAESKARKAAQQYLRCPILLAPAQAYEAKRTARDAEREAREAAQEEEIRRAAEERAKREEEEAAKWMHLFTVEEAGEGALSAEEGEVRLGGFVF